MAFAGVVLAYSSGLGWRPVAFAGVVVVACSLALAWGLVDSACLDGWRRVSAALQRWAPEGEGLWDEHLEPLAGDFASCGKKELAISLHSYFVSFL